jgi:hypothetical protein
MRDRHASLRSEAHAGGRGRWRGRATCLVGECNLAVHAGWGWQAGQASVYFGKQNANNFVFSSHSPGRGAGEAYEAPTDAAGANSTPVNRSDPSGHVAYEELDREINPMADRIVSEFGWILKGEDWPLPELQAIQAAGSQIRNHVDPITNGRGQHWMGRYLGGATFRHGGLFWGPYSFVSGRTIHLTTKWMDYGPAHITHELAHVWDNRTGLELQHPEAIWFGGGAADMIQEALGGGKVSGLRWMNGRNRKLPSDYQYPKEEYANHSTADYFADTFEYMLFYPEALKKEVPGSADLIKHIHTLIEIQASH